MHHPSARITPDRGVHIELVCGPPATPPSAPSTIPSWQADLAQRAVERVLAVESDGRRAAAAARDVAMKVKGLLEVMPRSRVSFCVLGSTIA